MKKMILAIAITLTSLAAAAGQPSEEDCLGMGKVGEVTARARLRGTTESELISKIPEYSYKQKQNPTPYEKRAGVVMSTIIKFVFTMELQPAEARKTVYLKCTAGMFGSYALN